MSALTIILFLLILGTVAALVFGVIVMARGGQGGDEAILENSRRQNKLMTYRIYFQAAAIGVLLLLFSIIKK